MLCAGFPCQPFSKAGNRQGFKDSKNGGLFQTILSVIDKQNKPPSYLILENVPNILSVEQGKYWSFIINSLIERGYEISWKIISPEDFGIPQGRKRIYLVGALNGLDDFEWPIKETSKELCISKFIANEAEDSRLLSDTKENALKLWSIFLDKIPTNQSLSFPIWADEFGANYPINGVHPSTYNYPINFEFRGSLGKKINIVNGIAQKENLPSYVRDGRKKIKPWKLNFIKKNRELYNSNKHWIDDWKIGLEELPISLRKLEWNCGNSRRIIDDKIIQFRPSGIRVKTSNSIPTLVAMNTTQTPYFPWLNRYMTIKEGLALQGFSELEFITDSPSQNYKAIGNAVNPEVVIRISRNLIKSVKK